jgi:hypothetical protein
MNPGALGCHGNEHLHCQTIKGCELFCYKTTDGYEQMSWVPLMFLIDGNSKLCSYEHQF